MIDIDSQTNSTIDSSQQQKPKHNQPFNGLWEYFNSTHLVYLTRKYSESNTINYEQSRNFIRKDLFQSYEEPMNNDCPKNEYEMLSPIGEYSNNEPKNLNYPSGNFEQFSQVPPMNYPQPQQFIIPMPFTDRCYVPKRQRFNSHQMCFTGNNFFNNMTESQINTINQSAYTCEMFGKKGWVCLLCNNFNYEGRVKCNRCGEPITPKQVFNVPIVHPVMIQRNFVRPVNNNERSGDWLCPKCENLNFAFRKYCNRCGLPKEDVRRIFAEQMNPMNVMSSSTPSFVNVNNNTKDNVKNGVGIKGISANINKIKTNLNNLDSNSNASSNDISPSSNSSNKSGQLNNFSSPFIHIVNNNKKNPKDRKIKDRTQRNHVKEDKEKSALGFSNNAAPAVF
ncbi:MAG: zinc finger Ran-binding domain-containing protein [archaeon]|nr:zinc finger Ran-binding domain-containing protein [archaeon]